MSIGSRYLIAGLLSVTLVACGGDDGPAGSPPPETTTETTGTTTAPATSTAVDGAEYPVTVTGDNGDVVIDAQPERMVVLSPSLTEMIYAIGAGDQVIAVDSYSNVPDDAPVTELSGFRPNIEAIGEYDPDLVVVARDRDDVVATLEGVGITVLVLSSADDIDDVYEQIGTIGVATGHADEAAAVTDSMRSEIDAQLARAPQFEEPPTYYYELSGDYHSLTSDTFVGSIFDAAGLVNVADTVDPAAGGYPQLSAEYILDADPDFIIVAHTDGSVPTIEELASRPGWGSLTAIESESVIWLDPEVAARWGPRIVDLVTEIVDGLEAHQP